MPYEQPAPSAPQQPEAPKPLQDSLSVRGTLLGALFAILAILIQGGVIPLGLEAGARDQVGALLLSVAAGFGVVAGVGFRRAIGLWLAMLTIVAAGCQGPDLRPTLSATRATLGALRADYARGRIVIQGAKPETLEALRAARVEEIDAADKALEAAEKSQ